MRVPGFLSREGFALLMSGSPRVHIAIPTRWKRDLGALFDGLWSLPEGVDVGFYAQEPPPDAMGFDAMPSHISHYPLSEQGYSSARNAAIDTVMRQQADFLLFLDDDELPTAGWLRTLLNVAGEYDADVVVGPVYALPLPKSAFANSESMRPYRPEPLGPISGHVATNNTLIRVDFLTRHGLRFDMAYNLCGGEDTDFFQRARQLDPVIVFAPDAVVVERVDRDRVSFRGRAEFGFSLSKRWVALNPDLTKPVPLRIRSIGVGVARLCRAAVLADRPAMGDAAFGIGRAVGLLPGKHHRKGA